MDKCKNCGNILQDEEQELCEDCKCEDCESYDFRIDEDDDL